MILKLSHGGASVVLNKSFDKKLPRVEVNPPTLDYNVIGTPVIKGSYYEPKYLWTISAEFSRLQYAQLQLIYKLSSKAARQLVNPAILLDDLTEPITEPVRTRALATGTAETIIPGGVCYYAQFQVLFIKPPEPTEHGDGTRLSLFDNIPAYRVSFVLGELEVVPA